MELEVNSLFGPERAYLAESEVDSSHVFSLLRGRVQGGVLEQTDLSSKFHEFPWVSIRFYAHALRRLQNIPIV